MMGRTKDRLAEAFIADKLSRKLCVDKFGTLEALIAKLLMCGDWHCIVSSIISVYILRLLISILSLLSLCGY